MEFALPRELNEGDQVELAREFASRLTSAGGERLPYTLAVHRGKGENPRAPQRLAWQQLYRQFGAHPAKASDNNTVQAFRYKVLRELKKIKLAWPDLNYATAPGVLILHPSTPAIPPSPEPLRLVE